MMKISTVAFVPVSTYMVCYKCGAMFENDTGIRKNMQCPNATCAGYILHEFETPDLAKAAYSKAHYY
jgi:hypothetical protein